MLEYSNRCDVFARATQHAIWWVQRAIHHHAAYVHVHFKITLRHINCAAHPMSDSIEILMGIANDVRDALSRIIRLEREAAVASVNNVQCSSTIKNIHSNVVVLQSQVQTLQSAVNSSGGDVTKTSQETKESDDSLVHFVLTDTDYCAFPKCKELLSHNNRACSSAVSLRHMLYCEACPPGVCRVLYILHHMSKFSRSPQVVLFFPVLTFPHTQQVCHADTCCYCGRSMPTLSPDARCNHRKACIVTAKDKCINPETQAAMVVLLESIWTPNQDTVNGPPAKRCRNDRATYYSPIIAGQAGDDRGFEGPPPLDRAFVTPPPLNIMYSDRYDEDNADDAVAVADAQWERNDSDAASIWSTDADATDAIAVANTNPMQMLLRVRV